MERFLTATRSQPRPAFPAIYAGILGARRCLRGGPCDLSRGIVTDATGRTIAIHPERPDSVFLHKLTMTWAAVVPAGSPARATLGVTPPGTGPYRVARWDGRRGGLLVRNPYFDAASRRRPAGFADRIEVRVRRSGTAEAQIRDVQRGNADLAVVANPFLSTVTPDRMRALVTDSPGRVHSVPVPTTDWMFLNMRRRPFDDLRVRRAVNLAVDRGRIVDLSGGPETGQPACQIVPIGFPAHEPYCPYTAQPSPAGTWTAPDLDRARRLVAESGRAREHVVVRMPPERRGVGRYITAVLNRIGLRATLRVPPGDGIDIVYDPDARVQLGPTGWAADYLAPATFIETNFACAASVDRGGLNLGRLCDRTLERRIDRARGLPPAVAAPAWAAADRRVIELAAAVPMTQRRAVVLVSRRVGNVRNHAQWFTLLDELWVR